ncbi:cytochrome P450 3A24-like [Watersipora subatra]|uniref:cytochrome P450 3A24-like n=1 Tax=Watersipora subatra TaxID=2589382 RepID=UPI00355B30F2
MPLLDVLNVVPLWFFLLVVALGLAYWYGTSTFGTFKKMGVPYLTPLPFVGNMIPQLSMALHEFDVVLAKKLPGRVYGMYQGREPLLEIRDVDMIKQVMIKDFTDFTNRRDVLAERSLVTVNVAGIKDAHWKHVRSVLTPNFTSGKLKQMFPVVSQCADKLVTHLRKTDSAPIAIKPFSEGYTMDVIASTAFGMDVDAQGSADHPFLQHAKPFFGIPNKRSNLKQTFIFLSFFLMPQSVRRFFGRFLDIGFVEQESLDYFGDIVTKILAETKNDASNKEKNFISTCADKHVDLDKSSEEPLISSDGLPWTPKGLTSDDIMANAFVFFTAGYETTASTLQFFCYNLALNPEVQEKLYEVICDATGDGTELCYDDLKKLDYLEMCINESMRLFPPVPKVDRVARRDVTINGIDIPKGMVVEIPIFVIQRDAEYWPEPEKFEPERFSPENKTESHQYTFMPFGLGNRSCIASRLAMLELRLAAVKLVKAFRFEKTAQTTELKDIVFGKAQAIASPTKPLIVSAVPRS